MSYLDAKRYMIRQNDPGDVDGEPARKKVPAKVMWYFPIIPRLKHLFRNKTNAKLMRWHKEERKQDQLMRHPADAKCPTKFLHVQNIISFYF